MHRLSQFFIVWLYTNRLNFLGRTWSWHREKGVPSGRARGGSAEANEIYQADLRPILLDEPREDFRRLKALVKVTLLVNSHQISREH